MKVVHVINRLIGGGAEVMVPQIHRRHLAAGVDSCIVSMETEDDRGTPNVVAFGRKFPVWQEPFRLRGVLCSLEKDGRIDIVHSHLTQSQIFSKFAVRGLGHRPRLVTTEHAPSNRRRSLAAGRFFDRALYSGYDRVVCISQGVSASMRAWLPDLASRLAVIPNGIDAEPFLAARRKPAAADACGPVRILSVGRLIAEKNFALVLRVLAGIGNPRWTYTIVGDGVCRVELQELAVELGIADRVCFAGYRTDVAALSAEHDVFLLPSVWEGFGLAAVEAMAAGLAVFASDVPGLSEVVGHGPDAGGVLLPVDDIGAWQQALRTAMNDPAGVAAMGRKAQSRSRMFTVERCAEAYLDLYREILDGES